MLFSDHNGYITASYALFALCMIGLTLRIYFKSRSTQKKIDQLNSQIGKTSEKL